MLRTQCRAGGRSAGKSEHVHTHAVGVADGMGRRPYLELDALPTGVALVVRKGADPNVRPQEGWGQVAKAAGKAHSTCKHRAVLIGKLALAS